MYNNSYTYRTFFGKNINRPTGDRDIYSDFIIPPYVSY